MQWALIEEEVSGTIIVNLASLTALSVVVFQMLAFALSTVRVVVSPRRNNQYTGNSRAKPITKKTTPPW